jgi:phosphoserine phosphatase
VHWVLEVLAGAASAIVSAGMLVLVREVRQFFNWVRRQGDLLEQLDQIGVKVLATSFALERTAARLERVATQSERANPPKEP